mmetsp:Transcript_17476/g.26410  ORF Transcript_17476/g.26410 Transcript_17476/m.26410 type:complete len:229 (-) Transcript_17476:31-717(-)
MPFASSASSVSRTFMASVDSSIEIWTSSMCLLKSFTLSSTESICFSQYSFFESSSTCSCLSKVTMSSIILRTLEKSTFFPDNASIKKSKAGLALEFFRELGSFFSTSRTWFRTWEPAFRTWMRLGLGRVFLKRSRASSSLRILIVSWMATSSAARVFWRSCHSLSLVEQEDSSSEASFWSAIKAASDSVRSAFMLATSTLSSPMLWIFFSIEAPRVSICFCFAAMSSS